MTATITHHADCDGYRFAHVGRVELVHPRMVQARCEQCGWRGQLYGQDAATTARREADGHTAEVRCDGRCHEWA